MYCYLMTKISRQVNLISIKKFTFTPNLHPINCKYPLYCIFVCDLCNNISLFFLLLLWNRTCVCMSSVYYFVLYREIPAANLNRFCVTVWECLLYSPVAKRILITSCSPTTRAVNLSRITRWVARQGKMH